MMLLILNLLIITIHVTLASNVVELTVENFHSFVKTKSLALVQFYAPWCGHCKTISPAFEKAANQLHELGLSTSLAKLDGSNPLVEELIANEKVDGYPTFLLYKNGHRIGEYHGNRTENDIVDYMQRKSIPAAKQIDSELELVPYISALDRTDHFQQGILGVVLGIFPGEEMLHSTEAKIFENVADRHEFAKFFVTNSASLIADFKVTTPAIIVFSADNRDVYHTISFTPTTTEDQIIDELLMLSMPLSIPMNSDMMSLLSAMPVMHALTFYDANGDDENFLDAVVSVMPQFKGKILMVEISSDEYHLLHHFGMESSTDLPQLILVDPSTDGNGCKFSFADFLRQFHHHQMTEGEEYEPIDHNVLLARFANIHYPMWIRPIAKAEDSDRLFYNTTLLEQFMRVFLENQDAQSINSQDDNEIAKLNELMSTSNIENIAASQFESRVLQDVTTDSFVFFHAPWCIHCKAMEAIMVELAEHYREDAHLGFYRIDAQKNDIVSPRQLKLVGLPAMYLFPAEDKMHPIFYDHDRNLQDMIDFIEQNRHKNSESSIERTVNAAGNLV